MTKPEEMPKFVEWSQSFVPPARPSGYISQHLSVTDTVLLLNLLTPPLVEVEGCILLRDRYFPTTFKQWSGQLNGSTQDIESVINQVNLWDVFDPQDPAEESALDDIARTLGRHLARTRAPSVPRSEVRQRVDRLVRAGGSHSSRSKMTVVGDIKTAIIDFADRMSPKVPSAAVADVKDWANHTEWSLALEVLAEHLFESGRTFSADEWTEFTRIIDLAQCEPARFEFVRPADG